MEGLLNLFLKIISILKEKKNFLANALLEFWVTFAIIYILACNWSKVTLDCQILDYFDLKISIEKSSLSRNWSNRNATTKGPASFFGLI